MAVDTLKLYERFSRAGMSDPVAKEVAEAIKESNEDLTARLVTKDDLRAEVANLKGEIANLKVELIKWMMGIAVGGFGALVALLKLLKVI